MPQRTNARPRWRARPAHSTTALVLLLLSSPSPAGPAAPAAVDPTTARQTFESYYDQWLDLLKQQDVLQPDERSAKIGSIIEGLFDLDALAAHAIPREWPALTPPERTRFRGALTRSLTRRLSGVMGEEDAAQPPVLELTKEVPGEGVARLEYLIRQANGKTESLAIEMLDTAQDGWKITELTYAKTGLGGLYRAQAGKLLKDYSFPYLVAELGDYPAVTLEDFEAGPVDSLPRGWTWKDSDNAKRKPYAVRREDDNHYLEATDNGESVILGKDLKWNLDKYPYVSFRLRVHRVPEGGDERSDKKVDSAAGVYFIYKKKLGLIPESIKYVWSTTLPAGSAVRRHGTGRPWMVVVGSGTDHLGEWRTYEFDLREAYRDTFGPKPPDRPIGIGILSDANSTHSHAYADYDDILALRSAGSSVTSGVTQILKPTDQ